MSNSPSKIRNLRITEYGIRESFEEFCCQVFHRAPEVPLDSRYRRIRGDGGDGGVEAIWTLVDGKIWGLQAKFFDALGAKQKSQIAESIRQAIANYPNLTRYFICLPINLTAKTGAKAGKPKTGQHEKLADWIAEWQSELTDAGYSVEFVIWDESELLGRLASLDTTGGLTRYWFDQDALTSGWFAERLTEAKAQAGARYSPQLAVATPLDDALQSFGRSETWIKRIETLSTNYSDKLDWWRKTAARDIEPLSDIPKELAVEANEVLVAAESFEESLALSGENPELLTLPSFRDAVQLSISSGTALESKLRQALLEKHGDNADSPSFRQWHAEYMVDFPMAPLDHLRNLLSALAEVEVLALQPEGQLPAATTMLIRGEAGVGKTHGIVDAAVRRNDAGLLSLVFFGEDVSGPDPWQPLIAKLGLGNSEGREAFLDALNAAGESTGFPLVIFIDALNETQPDRRRWQSWLPPMLEQVKRRPFLKLCLSCRETYAREVLPPALTVPSIEHNGFLGREYEAQFAFFQHYGLGVPAEPLLQEEFANPLFLRLVCEAFRECETQAVPAGREGIRAIVNLLLRAKNDHAALICDFDRRENRVGEAMLRLAGVMAAEGKRYLSLADAKSVVDGTSPPQSKSLFALLEAESLIAIIEQPAAGFTGEPTYSVRFTFERIGDHLIVEHLLAGVSNLDSAFSAGGSLHFFCVSDDAAQANAGLFEALSVQLPESHGKEIVDAIPFVDQGILLDAFISGLQWRNPKFISERSVQIVREALTSQETVESMFEAILGVAARPNHPLNVQFLHGSLERLHILARDPFWADMLEQSYSAWSDTARPKSGVRRLIEMARYGSLENLPDTVGVLWATALAWFCASPDRRIRDQATMAMVSVFKARPRTIPPLLRTFLLLKDEYVAERVLVAAYGALLLSESILDLKEAAAIVYEAYFGSDAPPLNVSLRDHSRLVLEMSVELGVPPPNIDVSLYRPPYKSPWPIATPDEDEVQAYVDDTKRFPRMNLVEKVGLATGSDFARYIVEPNVVNAFDMKKAGLNKLGIFRWFLREAVEFGYPGPDDQCALHDRILLSKFGGGRGKPGWAERLGKKYYWIFLRKLVGQLADHIDRKTWSSTFPPCGELQGLGLRDIDPTDLRQFLSPPSQDREWLVPNPYVFSGRDSLDTDGEWSELDNLTDISQTLTVVDSSGAEWQALEISASWNGKRIDRRDKSYRHVARSVLAVTCAVGDVPKVRKAFTVGGLDHFNNGPQDYRGYLGEYPKRLPYTSRLFDPLTFDDDAAGVKFQHLALRQLRGREWERDYSQIGETPTLLMPSPQLAQMGDLKWDHRGGWRDTSGEVQIEDPWWWSRDEAPALICRTGYIDKFLSESNRALIFMGYQSKFIVGAHDELRQTRERTLFIRHEGKTKSVKRICEKL